MRRCYNAKHERRIRRLIRKTEGRTEKQMNESFVFPFGLLNLESKLGGCNMYDVSLCETYAYSKP